MSAEYDWTNLGGLVFHNTYNDKAMELKGVAHTYSGTLYPIIQILYWEGSNFTTIFQFDMNGTFEYAGYLIQMDYMDDIAALRAVKSKKHESGVTIYDPDSLKFLQGHDGRYSLNACIGWELSIQQKFLEMHDSHEDRFAKLTQEIENLETQIAELKAKTRS
jgi:hypothetical protein